MKRTLIISVIAVFAFLLYPLLGQAEMGATDSKVMGIMSLTLNPVFSFIGYDHVANGIALRNEARGTIALRGIPLGSTVYKAYLYWNLSNTVATGAGSYIAYFNGNRVSGIKRADSADPCWGMAGNHTYRAEVTPFVPAQKPNGDYEVVMSSVISTSGQNPWDPSEAQSIRMEGATLIVIFSNATTATHKVYLYDTLSGSMFSGASTFILNHPTASGYGLFTMTGADGQRAGYTNGNSNEIGKFNGAQISGPPVASSDWDGSAGWPLPQLWDVHTHQVTLSGASSTVDYIATSDCLVPVAFVIQVGL